MKDIERDRLIEAYIDAIQKVNDRLGYRVTSIETLKLVFEAYVAKYSPPRKPALLFTVQDPISPPIPNTSTMQSGQPFRPSVPSLSQTPAEIHAMIHKDPLQRALSEFHRLVEEMYGLPDRSLEGDHKPPTNAAPQAETLPQNTIPWRPPSRLAVQKSILSDAQIADARRANNKALLDLLKLSPKKRPK